MWVHFSSSNLVVCTYFRFVYLALPLDKCLVCTYHISFFCQSAGKIKRKLPKHTSPREINIPALHLHFIVDDPMPPPRPRPLVDVNGDAITVASSRGATILRTMPPLPLSFVVVVVVIVGCVSIFFCFFLVCAIGDVMYLPVSDRGRKLPVLPDKWSKET
jgi:hypothetical protein